MIDWKKLNVSGDDIRLIGIIARRALAIFPMIHNGDLMSIQMDLEAVHGTSGLRLGDMITADNFNLGHDIIGIWHHLDRETGKLEDCFSPRFSKRSSK